MKTYVRSFWRSIIIGVGTVLLANLPVFAGSAPETIDLKLAFAGSPSTFSAKAHAWWAEEVERRTGGRLKISLFWGGSLAGHKEMVDMVGSGAIDMGESSWAPMNPKSFPLHTVADGPVIWRRQPLALIYAGMDLEKMVPEVEAENTKVNLKRLTWQGPGISGLLTRKDVQKISDINGLQLRVVGRYLQPPMYKALGAVPVGIPFPGIYDAMQKGVIDGATGTLGLFVGNKHYEIAKYYLEAGIGGDSGHGIMMNLAKYNSLPQDIKDILMQLYVDFPKVFAEKFAIPDYEKSKEIFNNAGVKMTTLSTEEVEKWKALNPAEEHVKPWIEGTVKASGLSEARVKEILAKYIELVDHYEKIYPETW